MNFDPSTATAAGFDPTQAKPAGFDPTRAAPAQPAFDPSKATVVPKATMPPQALIDRGADLWVKAGGEPRLARVMGLVMANESGGDPNAHSPTGEGVGLWQINPKVHGNANWTDPMTNAKKAVELYKTFGMKPWQDSMDKGAFGGWGGMLAQVMPTQGIPFVKPAAQAAKQALRTVAKADTDTVNLWTALQRHPLTTAFDILASAQRAVGGVARGIEQHDDLNAMVRELKDDVFGVFSSNEQHAEQVRTRTTESIRAAFHAPTHEAIDQWVSAHVPKMVQPYASALMKGGEDIGLQTASDPVSLAGGFIFKGVGALLHTAATFQEAHKVAQALGIGEHFSHLEPIYNGLHGVANAVGESKVASWFKSRPDLDDFQKGAPVIRGQPISGVSGGFTAEGKKMRLQIEHQAQGVMTTNRTLDEAAVDAASREERLKKYIATYGDASMRARLLKIDPKMQAEGIAPGYLRESKLRPTSQEARDLIKDQRIPKMTAEEKAAYKKMTPEQRKAYQEQRKATFAETRASTRLGSFFTDFRKMNAQEQQAVLASVRRDSMDGYIARRTQGIVEKYNKDNTILKPGSSITNYRNIPSESAAVRTIKDLADHIPGTRLFRDLARFAIFLNPLPHGFKNVGQLAYMAGGFPAVFRGMKAMITPGAIDAARLERIGARPLYSEHTLENSVWAKVIPGWAKWATAMQRGMTHLEEGWRHGLLETIDKKLGESKDLKDELLKGAMLTQHLGDYHNQSAFVHLFTAFGGPFVAFRLGIIPQAIMRTVRENPDRILLTLRTKYNVQEQRQGKRQNDLDPGGPINDWAQLWTNPLKFMLNPSTSGVVGQAAQAYASKPTGILPKVVGAGGYLSNFNPFGEVTDLLGTIAFGGRPGQQNQETLMDRLVDASLATMAIYFKREQSGKAIRQQQSQVRKSDTRATQPLDHFLDSLTSQDSHSEPTGFDPGTAGPASGFDPSTAK